MRKKLSEEKGLTLIEVLITSAVVVLVLVGFMGTTTALEQSSESAFERTMALQDAHQVVELIRNTAASGTFPGNVTAVYTNGGAVSGFSSLTSETVTVSYANPAANPLDTTITVQWLERGRRTVQATLHTIITQRS